MKPFGCWLFKIVFLIKDFVFSFENQFYDLVLTKFLFLKQSRKSSFMCITGGGRGLCDCRKTHELRYLISYFNGDIGGRLNRLSRCFDFDLKTYLLWYDVKFWFWKSFSKRFGYEIFKINFSVILDFELVFQFFNNFSQLCIQLKILNFTYINTERKFHKK